MTRTAHFIAHVDTGGIRYSGATFVGLGATEEEARAAVFACYMQGPKHVGYGEPPLTIEDLEDAFGIRVWGPLRDGEAIETEE
jgi:hypothetical protein